MATSKRSAPNSSRSRPTASGTSRSANQKNYISLYLMPVYIFPELRAKLDGSGKKSKCGKSCVNFRRADELPLETIAEIVGAHGVAAYKSRVLEARSEGKKK